MMSLLESVYTEMPQLSELMKYHLRIPALFQAKVKISFKIWFFSQNTCIDLHCIIL